MMTDPTAPVRLRRSRAKGAQLPADVVCVDRSTKHGNPFVVGVDGTAAECVMLYITLLGGLFALGSRATIEAQQAALDAARAGRATMRGRRLACYCGLDAPCHANVQLLIWNVPEGVTLTPTLMDWKLPGLAA